MFNPGNKNKKDMNFELNLLPVFDVLSACICFLLMTAVWIQLGSFEVSQAMGGQSVAETKNPPSVWAYMNKNGQVTLTLKDVTSGIGREFVVAGDKGQVSWKSLEVSLKKISSKLPQIKTALVMPNEATKYDDVVGIMDRLRGAGLSNIGIAPL